MARIGETNVAVVSKHLGAQIHHHQLLKRVRAVVEQEVPGSIELHA